MLKEKLLPASTLSKGTSVEWLSLLFLAVGVVAAIEAGTKLRVAEDFVCFVDFGHFLFGLFFRHALRDGFVRVELFGQGAVLAFDGPVVSVVGHVKYLVVIFGLGSF